MWNGPWEMGGGNFERMWENMVVKQVYKIKRHNSEATNSQHVILHFSTISFKSLIKYETLLLKISLYVQTQTIQVFTQIILKVKWSILRLEYV